jgi:hypothetical protein
MAKMDSFLRSSGLRLKPDGTCQFLFETTRFIIETTTDEEEAGEFLLYCSLGELRSLRDNHFKGSQRHLLKLLAVWNEELQNEGGDDTGLLRIDSSKEDGPHVSFIYYGQMSNIGSAEEFQELLDEFVDDALDFYERLNGGGGEEVEEEDVPVSRSWVANGGAPPENRGSTKSIKSHSTATTVNTLSSEESAYGSSQGGARGNSFHRTSPPSPPPQSATPSTAYASEFGSSAASLNTSQDKNSGKKSVFSKVMSTLQKKNDPTVAMAFIDPSNPTSAFVVDKTVANGEDCPKPKIVVSRKGAEKKGASFHADGRDNTRHAPTRNTKSFHDDRSGRIAKRTSLPDVQEDGRRGSMISKRSSQPSIGEESYDRRQKSSSFYDTKRSSMSDESSRKTKSFHYTGKSRRSSINPEDRIEKRISHNTSLNRSDIFNDSGVCDPNGGNFNYSEPVLPSHLKPRKSSRPKQVKVQPDTYYGSSKQHQDRYSHNSSLGHRRKTLSDAERPRTSEKQRRGAYPFGDGALKAYYDRHNAYPPPPPRNGSKWCMENDLHSESESEEYSGEERLYD